MLCVVLANLTSGGDDLIHIEMSTATRMSCRLGPIQSLGTDEAAIIPAYQSIVVRGVSASVSVWKEKIEQLQ